MMKDSPVKKLPDGQEGPECPWWLYIQRCVPDKAQKARWKSESDGELFAAIGLPGRLLEEWEDEVRSLGRESVCLVERLNNLLFSFDTRLRLKPDCSRVGIEIRRLAGKAKSAVVGASGTAGRLKVRQKIF